MVPVAESHKPHKPDTICSSQTHPGTPYVTQPPTSSIYLQILRISTNSKTHCRELTTLPLPTYGGHKPQTCNYIFLSFLFSDLSSPFFPPPHSVPFPPLFFDLLPFSMILHTHFPLNSDRAYGAAQQALQWGLGRSPSRRRIWDILSLKDCIWKKAIEKSNCI